MADESPARITRVKLKNYKSIVSCDVELRPLTILVGPNGSGKSNFVDALRFVKQALVLGLDQAIRNRGKRPAYSLGGQTNRRDYLRDRVGLPFGNRNAREVCLRDRGPA